MKSEGLGSIFISCLFDLQCSLSKSSEYKKQNLPPAQNQSPLLLLLLFQGSWISCWTLKSYSQLSCQQAVSRAVKSGRNNRLPRAISTSLPKPYVMHRIQEIWKVLKHCNITSTSSGNQWWARACQRGLEIRNKWERGQWPLAKKNDQHDSSLWI